MNMEYNLDRNKLNGVVLMENGKKINEVIDDILNKSFSLKKIKKNEDNKIVKSYESKNHQLVYCIDEDGNYIYVWISGALTGLIFEKEYLFSEKDKVLRDFQKNLRIINIKEVFI
jgi:hypothetical protein